MSNRDLKRIALLLPNTDTILETDLQISLPSNIIIHTARMQLDEVGKEAEKRMDADKAEYYKTSGIDRRRH